MIDFGDGHPCAGKDCIECETCIFDRELFLDGITPNEEKKNKTSNNMCSNNRLCNNCPNLTRNYEHCEEGHFDAACKVVSYEAFGEKRPRRIDYNLAPNQSIASPTWCPLKDSGAQLLLTAKPSDTPSPAIAKAPTYTTYTERREKMKSLKSHLSWDEIQEGKTYVIPRILNQSRKIVKVITKTELSCTCHEISEYTGAEYTYNSTFYPSDLDAVFIAEIHEF